MKRSGIMMKVSDNSTCFYCKRCDRDIYICLICKKFCCNCCISDREEYCYSCNNDALIGDGSYISVPTSTRETSKIIFVKSKKNKFNCCFGIF